MEKRVVSTRHRLRLASMALAAMLPASAWSLGLGDITLNSYLNEPLAAEVELLDVQSLTAEDIRVRLATQDAFDRLGVDRAYFLTSINFEVIVEGGVGKILLTTTKPLLEPYLDFLVETRWPDGRLLREYTVLVDLPATPRASASSATLGAASSARAAEDEQVDAPSTTSSARLVQPETRPDRDYDRDAESSPRTGGRYLVQSNDTLWEIAAAAAPEGASIEQTMLATVQMNNDAFAGSNINGLKAGYVLEMPSERDILMSRREAFAAVAQANEDWRNGVRRSPALRVVADDNLGPESEDFDRATDDDVASSDVAERNDLAPAEMLASGAEPEPLGPVQDDRSPIPAQPNTGDSLPAAGPSSSELIEIQAQLTALSEQVGNLRELVVVKDQQIAALEAQLAAQRAEVVPASIEPKPVTPQPESVDRGYPWWLFTLAGVALLAIAAVVYTRRLQRPVMVLKRSAPPADLEPNVSRPNELDVPSLTEATELRNVADGERGYGQLLHNDYAEESVVADAVAEADIYVAYGRYQQALNLLDTAAQTDPDDPAAVLKMVEIYIKNDRIGEAHEVARRLEGLGDRSAFGQASRMLSEAEASGSGIDLGELAEEPTVPNLRAEPDVGGDATAPTLDLDLDLDLGLSGEAQVESAAIDPLESEFDLQGAAAANLSEDLSGSDEAIERDAVLPAELAEVLGTDVPPPMQEAGADSEGLVYAEEVDPIDTQLDLARAYIDMGDEDGARPVLNDVIASGDLRQQAEARELLVSID